MGSKVSREDNNDSQKKWLMQESKFKPSTAVWPTTGSGISAHLSEAPEEDAALMKLAVPPRAAESISEFIAGAPGYIPGTPGYTPTQESGSYWPPLTPSTPGDVHMTGFVG
eukprot:Hpha_TRINITY_DN15496_c0_g3::TRINITY_DN15496_c0_g3_i1::g.173330::m.173330